MADALVASLYGLDEPDFRSLLADCDHPLSTVTSRKSSELRGKGFWRVDKNKPPELRHTVLAQIAFADLQRHIDSAAADPEAGIQSFMAQNHGEGWRPPETLRLADYNLGHDDRAKEHQPVATELGPRFYDWQLAQTPEEAWAETHLHARNLLGEHGYRRLNANLEEPGPDQPPGALVAPASQVAEERHRRDDWLSRSGGEHRTRTIRQHRQAAGPLRLTATGEVRAAPRAVRRPFDKAQRRDRSGRPRSEEQGRSRGHPSDAARATHEAARGARH